ncbi:hypothetical protein N9E48_10680 [Paracoccaceae bacterium]|nr:hypothetical protein [Paracoccaceae bacterium]
MYLDNNFSSATLQTYQGYSLQVFASGRIKLSFHRSHTDRVEYYCAKAKRCKEAYKRQHTRSYTLMPEHFDLVDRLLASPSRYLIHRVHLKGDTNATADNAHVVTDIDQGCMTVVLDALHHQWFLPRPVVNALLEASGPKKGQGSIFNEYMATYEHDWEDAVFEEQYHQKGYREPPRNRPHDNCYDDELDF